MAVVPDGLQALLLEGVHATEEVVRAQMPLRGNIALLTVKATTSSFPFLLPSLICSRIHVGVRWGCKNSPKMSERSPPKVYLTG